MIREVLDTQVRLLTFRRVTPDLRAHLPAYLAWVLAVSWLAGMGRYWDHPRAEWWQYAGLGSVAYIFVLSALLWLVVLPLRPARWSYRGVLVFVGLTSLPALLYAVPVERFLSLDAAQSANALFLGIVATWRVALYARYLFTAARLDAARVFVATLLPLSAIVVSLALLNLEHVVFDLMAGIRDSVASPHDEAYQVVFLLSVFAYLAFPVTAIMYVGVIWYTWRQARRPAAPPDRE